MRAFTLLEPSTAREATVMLATHGDDARPIAGGISLLLLLRSRLAHFPVLVDVSRLRELAMIRHESDGSLVIGALATHAEVAASDRVKATHPVIAEMASAVANPQIRNVGTIGGNLCFGDPASDPPTCLTALDARVRVLRDRETREIPIDAFFRGYYESALEIGDLVTEIVVPPLPPGGLALYSRFTANAAEGRPLASIGVRVVGAAAGEWSGVRIAVGAVSSQPRRALAAESLLTDSRPTRDRAVEAASAAARDIEPMNDFRASDEYRRTVVRVVLRRVLERAMEASQR
ncbi:MAG: xanthine dehydrogenase family protein subunit M [Lautropia sp.]